MTSELRAYERTVGRTVLGGGVLLAQRPCQLQQFAITRPGDQLQPTRFNRPSAWFISVSTDLMQSDGLKTFHGPTCGPDEVAGCYLLCQ
ncbi:hypothetical protein EPR50_G00074650 [Perca flavescens]|uniref:Uncharacterized protein n=1 Tax=Perca flavescens TaxID=8167 RepID=A0A484D5G6_PERFV|nr:hypothetical protein EPR50_G00074650 [Perca flavescens]